MLVFSRLDNRLRVAGTAELNGYNLALNKVRCKMLVRRALEVFPGISKPEMATFWAGFMRLPEDVGLVNVDLKLNYLKAVAGGKLRADGRCLRAGRQISYAEASVFDEAGELIAHGTSTLMALPGKGLKIDVAKFLPQA